MPLLALAPQASAARTTAPCWKYVLTDAYAGTFDQIYPLHCYHEAMSHIPVTNLIYSNTADEIRTAELRAANGKPYSIRAVQNTPVATSSRSSALPLPVIVLGVLAAVLLLAGGAGELWRRTRRS